MNRSAGTDTDPGDQNRAGYPDHLPGDSRAGDQTAAGSPEMAQTPCAPGSRNPASFREGILQLRGAIDSYLIGKSGEGEIRRMIADLAASGRIPSAPAPAVSPASVKAIPRSVPETAAAPVTGAGTGSLPGAQPEITATPAQTAGPVPENFRSSLANGFSPAAGTVPAAAATGPASAPIPELTPAPAPSSRGLTFESLTGKMLSGIFAAVFLAAGLIMAASSLNWNFGSGGRFALMLLLSALMILPGIRGGSGVRNVLFGTGFTLLYTTLYCGSFVFKFSFMPPALWPIWAVLWALLLLMSRQDRGVLPQILAQIGIVVSMPVCIGSGITGPGAAFMAAAAAEIPLLVASWRRPRFPDLAVSAGTTLLLLIMLALPRTGDHTPEILCAGLLSLLITGILLQTCRLAAPDFGKRATFTAVLAVQAAVTAEVLLDCLLGTGLLTAILHSRPDTALPSPAAISLAPPVLAAVLLLPHMILSLLEDLVHRRAGRISAPAGAAPDGTSGSSAASSLSSSLPSDSVSAQDSAASSSSGSDSEAGASFPLTGAVSGAALVYTAAAALGGDSLLGMLLREGMDLGVPDLRDPFVTWLLPLAACFHALGAGLSRRHGILAIILGIMSFAPVAGLPLRGEDVTDWLLLLLSSGTLGCGVFQFLGAAGSSGECSAPAPRLPGRGSVRSAALALLPWAGGIAAGVLFAALAAGGLLRDLRPVVPVMPLALAILAPFAGILLLRHRKDGAALRNDPLLAPGILLLLWGATLFFAAFLGSLAFHDGAPAGLLAAGCLLAPLTSFLLSRGRKTGEDTALRPLSRESSPGAPEDGTGNTAGSQPADLRETSPGSGATGLAAVTAPALTPKLRAMGSILCWSAVAGALLAYITEGSLSRTAELQRVMMPANPDLLPHWLLWLLFTLAMLFILFAGPPREFRKGAGRGRIMYQGLAVLLAGILIARGFFVRDVDSFLAMYPLCAGVWLFGALKRSIPVKGAALLLAGAATAVILASGWTGSWGDPLRTVFVLVTWLALAAGVGELLPGRGRALGSALVTVAFAPAFFDLPWLWIWLIPGAAHACAGQLLKSPGHTLAAGLSGITAVTAATAEMHLYPIAGCVLGGAAIAGLLTALISWISARPSYVPPGQVLILPGAGATVLTVGGSVLQMVILILCAVTMDWAGPISTEAGQEICIAGGALLGLLLLLRGSGSWGMPEGACRITGVGLLLGVICCLGSLHAGKTATLTGAAWCLLLAGILMLGLILSPVGRICRLTGQHPAPDHERTAARGGFLILTSALLLASWFVLAEISDQPQISPWPGFLATGLLSFVSVPLLFENQRHLLLKYLYSALKFFLLLWFLTREIMNCSPHTWSMLAVLASFVILTAGFRFRIRELRLLALAAAALFSAKLFLVDMNYDSDLGRAVSLLATGAVLLGISLIYHRYGRKAPEDREKAAGDRR